MGAKESILKEEGRANIPLQTPRTRKAISEMQKRVAIKKEKLFQECMEETKRMSTQNNWNESFDVYSNFLSQRNTKHKKEQGGLAQSSSRMELKRNSKYCIPNASGLAKFEEEKHPIKFLRTKRLEKATANKIGIEKVQKKSTRRCLSKFEEDYLKLQASLHSFPSKETISLKAYSPLVRGKQATFDLLSLLPPNVFFQILSFGIEGFRDYLCVNPSWYCAIIESFNESFNLIENKFVIEYSGKLLFKDSYISSTVMKFCDITGTKIDRVIRCENLKPNLGKTITLGYKFNFLGEKKNKYLAQFTFDAIKKEKRLVWVFKNECSFNGDDIFRADTPEIQPICVGDNLEFAINFYSLRGLVDINTIEWMPLQESIIRPKDIKQYNVDDYREQEEDSSRKVFVDLRRMCELEDSERWRDFLCENHRTHSLNFTAFSKNFLIREVEFSDLDIKAFRITLEATQVGMVPYDIFGISIHIQNFTEECTNEIKRVGLLFERHAELQLRIGDILLFYYAESPGF